jgi:hypothetical protein
VNTRGSADSVSGSRGVTDTISRSHGVSQGVTASESWVRACPKAGRKANRWAAATTPVAAMA